MNESTVPPVVVQGELEEEADRSDGVPLVPVEDARGPLAVAHRQRRHRGRLIVVDVEDVVPSPLPRGERTHEHGSLIRDDQRPVIDRREDVSAWDGDPVARAGAVAEAPHDPDREPGASPVEGRRCLPRFDQGHRPLEEGALAGLQVYLDRRVAVVGLGLGRHPAEELVLPLAASVLVGQLDGGGFGRPAPLE